MPRLLLRHGRRHRGRRAQRAQGEERAAGGSAGRARASPPLLRPAQPHQEAARAREAVWPRAGVPGDRQSVGGAQHRHAAHGEVAPALHQQDGRRR